MVLFKIRKKGTDLYSSGGGSPRWTRKGKAWTSLGHVKNHLATACHRNWGAVGGIYTAGDVEVVEFVVQEKTATDLAVIQQQVKDAKDKRVQKAADALKREQEKLERDQLRLLLEKYPTE